jgi:hypothetical protein
MAKAALLERLPTSRKTLWWWRRDEPSYFEVNFIGTSLVDGMAANLTRPPRPPTRAC